MAIQWTENLKHQKLAREVAQKCQSTLLESISPVTVEYWARKFIAPALALVERKAARKHVCDSE